MTTILRAALVAGCLALTFHAFAPDARAQQGDVPTLTTDDVPTMTSDDAPSTAPHAPAASDVEQFWQRVYLELERTPGIPRDDADRFRSVIEGGSMVGFAMRFDVVTGGKVQNFVLEQSTGIPSLDTTLRQLATQTLPRASRTGATMKNVRIEAGISKLRVRLSVASDAPSEEEAIRFEREIEKMRAEAPLPPSQSHLLDGIGVQRDGTRVTFNVDLPVASLLSVVGAMR